MNRTILITGATGLVGKEIVKQLLEQNYNVHYLTHSKSKTNAISNAKGFYWNTETGEFDLDCLKSVSKIIHLAGASIAVRWTAENKKRILDSRLNSTQLLYNKLKEVPNTVNQIVCASAIGIYSSSLNEMYTENSLIANDSFLGNVSQQWEKATNQFTELGLQLAQVRIGIVLSGKGGALLEMVKPVKQYIGAALGSGKQWQSWIHIKDIAAIFIHLLKNNLSGVYNGVAPNPVTNTILTKRIAKQLGKPLFLPNVPEFMLKLILGEMYKLVVESQQVSSRKIESEGFVFSYKEIDLALKNVFK